MATQNLPRVIIIGAGFGGLYAAKTLANKSVDVLVIDRHNYHTFTPLLYQVATSALEPGEIAYPVRATFRRKTNIHFMMGEVTAIDARNQHVMVKTNGITRREAYDMLIVAGGSVTNTFGNEGIAAHSFGLKDLHDAVTLRNHILGLIEKAAWSTDAAEREAYMTLVVVGGGPTGLETAGALYELYNHVLRKEFTQHGDLRARVILIEAMDRLLAPYPESLQKAALRQLEGLGVEVLLNAVVADAGSGFIKLDGGRMIRTHTLVWAAGVKASPLGKMLGVPLQRGGRIPVQPTMQVVGLNNVYVVGDLAYLEAPDGAPYPMLIPVAKQQGMLAAKNILRRIRKQPEQTFHYIDRGIMATIGRRRAVAWIFYRIKLTGFLAWLAWLGLHLVTLIGFRNRLNVLINWTWNYFVFPLPGAYSSRLILAVKERRNEPDVSLAQEDAVLADEYLPVSD